MFDVRLESALTLKETAGRQSDGSFAANQCSHTDPLLVCIINDTYKMSWEGSGLPDSVRLSSVLRNVTFSG